MKKESKPTVAAAKKPQRQIVKRAEEPHTDRRGVRQASVPRGGELLARPTVADERFAQGAPAE
jgi:hypothetical protein